MADPLNDSIIALGHDISVEKLYYVATCALWTYDYILTIGDEVTYAWAGKKTYIFYLYLANRYLTPCASIVTLFCDCTRFCAALSFEAALTSSIAEIFLTLRVYAITGKRKLVLVASATLILCQWGALIYQASQASH
ncbi:hypothetical protein DENSPDRAFT_462538 [Dentipellis sp. KUC8613]|nr:hypothetical protein DENSPDRAFT_462538 [Dentipellis sp. KUC8613]